MKDLLKKTKNNKMLKESLTMSRGFLAAVILFIALNIDAIAIKKYIESGLPHIPGTVLVSELIISILLIIGTTTIPLVLNKEFKKLRESKTLSAFLFGSGTICITIAIISEINLYSLYSKHIIETTLPPTHKKAPPSIRWR
ncbi:MAG: hypothetical protein JHC31_10735 [Sulfurihydrogenibium sp.]|nr:hypothetical protein [Sulfurihydrogenibium sp.]